jgi:ubiquitin-conjugating enzyme E2 Z
MATKRILRDISELETKLYSDLGIYYVVDETNVHKGFGCIFGPKDTPYEDCPMLFSFDIGIDYPFNPPKVLFRTYDGMTRFHPNMYKEGKVCLSILGTWEGPSWTSSSKLSTILVTLQSLMDSDPILHEPGYKLPSQEMKEGYAKYVEHACIQYILERAEKTVQPDAFLPFQDIFKQRLPEILLRLETRLQNLVKEEKTFQGLPYQLFGKTNYSNLLQRVIKLKGISK